jgi:hypothetical protein
MLLAVLFVPSCSDQPGWTLWGHWYEQTDEITNVDNWYSYDSYSNLADCKTQIAPLVAKETKNYEEMNSQFPGKISVQSEKDSVRAKATGPKISLTYRESFFCVPFGVDPRPKDQSTWTLWEEYSNGKSRSWEPYGSYLTGAACGLGKKYFEKSNRDSQTLNKEPHKVPSYTTLYHCFATGVPPWGKEG